MKTHCHETHYTFQVKKYFDSACYYCGQHPVRLPQDIFTGLQFVPPPLLNSTKDHYKKFSDLYGEIPSDKDRLSHTPVPSEEEKQVDKGRKSLLLRRKVRGCIACEYNKQRCIYSHSKLTPSEVTEISQTKKSKLFTCGSVLFPPGSSHESTIGFREALMCVINIETQ